MFSFNFKKIFIIFVVSLNFGITNTVFCMKKENEKKLTNQSSKKNLKPVKKQSKTTENKPTGTSKKQTDVHPKKNLSKAKPKISSTLKKTTIPKKSVNTTKEQTTLLKDITQTTKKIDKKAKEKNLKNIKINSEEPKTKNQDDNNIEKINNCILKFSPLGLMHDSYDDSLIGTWEMLRKTGVYSIYNNFNKATNILNDDKTFRDSNGRIIGKWEKRANDKFYIESNENINTESKKEEIKDQIKKDIELDISENIIQRHGGGLLEFILLKTVDHNDTEINSEINEKIKTTDSPKAGNLAFINAKFIYNFFTDNENIMKNGWIKLINNKIQAKKNLETSIKNGEKTSFLNSEDIQHRIRKAELEEHITVVNSIFQFENIENNFPAIFKKFKNSKDCHHIFIVNTAEILNEGILDREKESIEKITNQKIDNNSFNELKNSIENHWYVIAITKKDRKRKCFIIDTTPGASQSEDLINIDRNDLIAYGLLNSIREILGPRLRRNAQIEGKRIFNAKFNSKINNLKNIANTNKNEAENLNTTQTSEYPKIDKQEEENNSNKEKATENKKVDPSDDEPTIRDVKTGKIEIPKVEIRTTENKKIGQSDDESTMRDVIKNDSLQKSEPQNKHEQNKEPSIKSEKKYTKSDDYFQVVKNSKDVKESSSMQPVENMQEKVELKTQQQRNTCTNVYHEDYVSEYKDGKVITKYIGHKHENPIATEFITKFPINFTISTRCKKDNPESTVNNETENIDAKKTNEQPKANKQEEVKNTESIKKEDKNKIHFIDNSIFLPYIKNHKNIDDINFVQLNTAFLKLFYKSDKSQNSKKCEFTDFFSHYLAISNAILINEFLENNETWPLDAINNIEIQYNKLQKYMRSETEKDSNTSIYEQKKKIKNEISKLGLSKKITVIDDATDLTDSIKKSIIDNFKNLGNYSHTFIISTNDLNVLLRIGIIQLEQESKCELSEKEQKLFFSKERFSNNWYVIGITKQDKEITCLISDANGYNNHINDQVLFSRNQCLCDYLIKQKDFEICRNEFYKKNMTPILKGLNILSFPPKLLNAIEESEKEDNKRNRNQNNYDKPKVKNVNKEPKNQSSDTTIKDSSNTNSTANSVTTKMTAKERVNQVLDFASSKNILMEGVNLLEVTPENGQKITNTVYQLRVAQQRQNSCGPRALYNAHCLKTAFDNDQGIYLKGVDMLNDLNDLSDDSENPKIRSFFREMHGATKTTYKTNDKTKARILDENRKAIPVEERIFIGKFDFDIDDGAPVWVDANPLNDFINFCSPINNKLFKIKDIDILPGYAESFIDEFIDATKKDLIGSLPKKNIGFSHGYVILIPGHYISLVVVKTGENEYVWFTLDSSNDSGIEKDYTKAYICKLLGYNDQEYEKKVKKSTKDYTEAEEKRFKKEHETKLKKADLKSKENTTELEPKGPTPAKLTAEPSNNFDGLIIRPKLKRDLKEIAFNNCPQVIKDLISDYKKDPNSDDQPQTILLYGPNGTGKSTIGVLIGEKTDREVIVIPSALLANTFENSAITNLREILLGLSKENKRYVIVIEEADALTRKRESNTNEMNIDIGLGLLLDTYLGNPNFFFVWTTNERDLIEKRFKDRLGEEIEIPLPDLNARRQAINNLIQSKNINLVESLSVDYIAKKTDKFSLRKIKILMDRSSRKAKRKYDEKEIKGKNFKPSLSRQEFDPELKVVKTIIDEDNPWWKPIIENKAVKFVGNKVDRLLDAGVSSVPGYIEGKLNEPKKEKEVKGAWNKTKRCFGKGCEWCGDNWDKLISAGATLTALGCKIFGKNK